VRYGVGCGGNGPDCRVNCYLLTLGARVTRSVDNGERWVTDTASEAINPAIPALDWDIIFRTAQLWGLWRRLHHIYGDLSWEDSVRICALTCIAAAPGQNPLLVVQSGHSGRIQAIAYSPDGRLLASASSDRQVILWDVVRACEIRTFAGHDQAVNAVRFSPDGRTLASAREDRTIKIWDVRTGAELKTLTGHSGTITSLTFSPEGRMLYSAGADGTIRVWDLGLGSLISTNVIRIQQTDVKLSDEFPMAISPDGHTLALGSPDPEIQLRTTSNPGSPRILKLARASAVSIAFSPNGRTLAVGLNAGKGPACCVGQVKLFELASGREMRTLAVGPDEPRLAFSPDGRTLVVNGRDWLGIWDVKTGNEIRSIVRERSERSNAIAVSPNGKAIAATDYDSIVLVDFASTRDIAVLRAKHAGKVNALAFTPDGGTLAAGLDSGVVKLWNFRTGMLRTFHGFGNKVWDLAFTPDASRLVATTDYTTVRFKDFATGSDAGMIADQGRGVSALGMSRDGRMFATTNDSYRASVWDAASIQPHCDSYPCNKMKFVLEGHRDELWAITFSPDGRTIATGSSDRLVKLWDVNTGRELRTLTGHQDSVGAIAFSPDSRIIATGANDHQIKLWIPRTDSSSARSKLTPRSFHSYPSALTGVRPPRQAGIRRLSFGTSRQAN
jgi:WD40 repeat protein